MNNTFDFKRFGAVVDRDWHALVRNFGITFLVFCSFPTLVWLTSFVFGIGEIDESVRWFVVIVSSLLAVMVAAEKVYGKANLPREGVDFAMLPATNLEKFFSMLLFCAIVIPIASVIGLWSVDAVLALIPLPIYKGLLSIPLEEISYLGWLIVFLIVCSWFIPALFMLGNMFFTRRKTAKTFAWTWLIVFVIVIVLQIFDAWEGICNFFDHMNESFVPWFFVILVFAVDCVLFYFTYRRIKNQKY